MSAGFTHFCVCDYQRELFEFERILCNIEKKKVTYLLLEADFVHPKYHRIYNVSLRIPPSPSPSPPPTSPASRNNSVVSSIMRTNKLVRRFQSILLLSQGIYAYILVFDFATALQTRWIHAYILKRNLSLYEISFTKCH